MRTFGKAILQTMPEAEIQRKTGDFKCRGIQTLLFRWEVCFGTDRERGEKELQELVEEIFQKNFERTERGKSNSICCIVNRKNSPRWKSGYLFKIDNRNGVEKT